MAVAATDDAGGSALDVAVDGMFSEGDLTAEKLAEIMEIPDADARAFQQAEFDAALEDAGKSREDLAAKEPVGDEPDKDKAGAEPDPEPEPKPEEADKSSAQTVPLKRFNEMVGRVKFLEGALAATSAGKRGEDKKDQPTASEQAEARKADIDKELDAIDDMVADGDMSNTEARKKRRALEAEYSKIERDLEMSKPEVLEQMIENDPWVNQQLDKLEADNPWLKPTSEADLAALAGGLRALAPAAEKLVAKDPNVDDKDPYAVAVARKWYMVQLAKSNGLAGRFGYVKPEKGDGKADDGKAKAAEAKTSDGKKGADKSILADAMPPDISAAGTPAPDEGMTEEAFEKLTPAEQSRWIEENPEKADAMIGLR